MRDAIGKRWFPLLSFPMVFLGQSTFGFLACLPFYGMFRNRFSSTTPVDIVGISIALAGIVLETAADEQMDQFQSEQRRRIDKQRGERADHVAGELAVLDKGLWAWSRHPNYFGECLFWWGIWVCASCELGPALIGPISTTLLFFGLSIPLMEERQLERRGEEYERYSKRVPSSFFLIPPFISRIIWPVVEKEQEDDDEGEEEEVDGEDDEGDEDEIDHEPEGKSVPAMTKKKQ